MPDGDEVSFQSPTTGKVQVVPPEHWEAALGQGYKPTTHSVMYSPDGQRGMVSNADRYAKTQAGFTDTPKTQFEKQRSPENQTGFWGTVGAKLKGMMPESPTGGRPLSDPKAWLNVSAQTPPMLHQATRPLPKDLPTDVLGGKGTAGAGPLGRGIYRAATTLSPLVPFADPEAMEKASATGDTGAVAAEAAMPIATALAPEVGEQVAKLGPKMAPKVANRVLRPVPTQLEEASRFGRNPGQAIADEGIMAGSHEGLVNKIETKKKALGKQIGDTLKTSNAQPVNVTTHIQQPINDMIQAAADGKVEGGEALISRLQELRNQYMTKRELQSDGTLKAMGPKNLTLTPKEMHELKVQIGDNTKWTGQAFDGEINEVKRGMYRNLNQEVEKQVPSVKPLQDRYGNLLEAKTAANRETARHAARNPFSLLDVGAGGIGGILGAAHSPAAGALTAVGLPLARHAAQSVLGRTALTHGLQIAPEVATAAKVGRAAGYQPLLGKKPTPDQNQ